MINPERSSIDLGEQEVLADIEKFGWQLRCLAGYDCSRGEFTTIHTA
ncbi:MAG: hypothetical protein ACLQDV_10115 [Candidatus Binataceae bacterium]